MDLSIVNGPIGGALIAFVAGLSVFWLTQRHQLQLDSLRDARTLRDARRERLWATYQTVLVTAYEIQKTLGEDEVPASFEAVLGELTNMRARLALEGSTNLTHGVLELFDLAIRICDRRAEVLKQGVRSGGTVESVLEDPRVKELLAETGLKIEQLQATMYASLASFDTPISSLTAAAGRATTESSWRGVRFGLLHRLLHNAPKRASDEIKRTRNPLQGGEGGIMPKGGFQRSRGGVPRLGTPRSHVLEGV